MDLENENLQIEYKKAESALPDSFWETYSAFGNTNGGIIYLGIDENNKNKPIQGVYNAEQMVQNLFNQVRNKQKVSVQLISDDNVEFIDIENSSKKIIKIYIPEASDENKPVYLKNNMNNSYKRLGEGDVLLTDSEIKSLVANSQHNYDNQLLPKFNINDLNEATIKKYRDILIEKTGDYSFNDISIEDFLIKIGAYKLDRRINQYQLTTGGLIFFGKYNSIVDRFPHFQIDYFLKDSSLSDERWRDRVSTGDMEFPELNMFEFYLKVIEKLLNTTQDTFYLDDNNDSRLPFKKDLSESVREAFVNMLMHAYYDSDFPIKVTAYPEYYEFKNPGKMKITISEFIRGGSSKVRNTTISTLFRRIGASERAGSGGPKIFDTAGKYKLKTPEVSTEFDNTTVRLWKVDILQSYSKLPLEQYKIMKYIIENGSITKNIGINKLKIPEYTFRQSLNTLLENKELIVIGKSRSTKYILPPNKSATVHALKQELKRIEDKINNM